MAFRHLRIDDSPPCSQMAFCLTTDLTGNGRPDVVIGAYGTDSFVEVPFRQREVNLQHAPVLGDILQRLETNVFWYENPSWERHDVAHASELSVGGALGDITGNGRPDLVAGQNINRHNLWWFEIPADPRRTWTKRLITDDFEKYHDVAVADVDDDGELEIVALSQESAAVFYYDIPDDPRKEPWPIANRHIVAEGVNVEGLVVTDLDDDGTTEIVAGPNVFHRTDDDRWERESIAEGWEWTRVAVADMDDDGDDEVLLVEGDVPYAEDRPARLGLFDPPDWSPMVLHEDLSNPHTLQVADFDNDGALDVFVAEMGLEPGHAPRQFLFRNDGAGTFEPELLQTGIPTHEAKAIDLDNDGRVDLVGKAYTERHVDVWFNEG